jgi:hypothetical protein
MAIEEKLLARAEQAVSEDDMPRAYRLTMRYMAIAAHRHSSAASSFEIGV